MILSFVYIRCLLDMSAEKLKRGANKSGINKKYISLNVPLNISDGTFWCNKKKNYQLACKQKSFW